MPWRTALATICGMNHADVTAEQASTIGAAIVPTLEYLSKLDERMRRRGFPADDPLMTKVMFALESMRQLRAGLHEIETPASSPIAAAQITPEAPQWRRAIGGDDRP